jgi:hypothetical protein
LLSALSFGSAAFPQVATNPAVQQVQLLAPQLLAFAGSSANFQSLVNGLTQGTPVTLTTLGGDGTVQIVTFAPATTMTALDAARLLESARQSLISRGIAAPTAQQLGIALMGGALPTALGTAPVTGLLSGNAGATPIQVRTETAVSALPGTAAGAISQANLQAIQAGMAQNVPVTIPGASGNVTFGAPGRPMSTLEINQALQLAGIMLAQQGITSPTAEQLQAALLGGSVSTAAGTVPLQGILQGQVRNTSDSALFGTSDSASFGTSDTPSAVSAPTSRIIAGPGAAAGGTTAAAPTAGRIAPGPSTVGGTTTGRTAVAPGTGVVTRR